MGFEPKEHLTKLRGKSGDYLEVKWRLVWFRDRHPEGEIETSLLHLDLEKGIAVFKATVKDTAGASADGHGSESAKDFGDYIEKAETKAIGRALAALGYGTQFAPELEEGERIVDSPVQQHNGHTPADAETMDKIRRFCKSLGYDEPQEHLSQVTATNLLRTLQQDYVAKKPMKSTA